MNEDGENSSSQDADDPVEALKRRLREKEQRLVGELAKVRGQLSRFRRARPRGVAYGNSTQAIVDAVRATPGVSSTEIAEHTGLPRGSILKLLRDILDKGVLRREGEPQHFRYYPADFDDPRG